MLLTIQPALAVPPTAVVALSRQVFEAAAGEHMAGAVCAFLRRQRLTSLRWGTQPELFVNSASRNGQAPGLPPWEPVPTSS